ncbi:MAG: hypothetical protein JXR80_05930 [Deltaproteobacteria bacterium]|nr:hypothetical protein [Deltaproteobacteria bacterium]
MFPVDHVPGFGGIDRETWLQRSANTLPAYGVIFALPLYLFSLIFLGRMTGFSYLPFVTAYLGALAAYFIILANLPQLSHRTLILLLLIGTGARFFLVFQKPLLSDDLYRCLWEGIVTLNGKNPYRLAPAAPELESLRPVWHHLINHAAYPAIYPPLTTLFNTMVAWIYPNPFFYKGCLSLADLLLTLIIGLRLRFLHKPRRDLLLYFLHPLPILEISGNGHHEALVLLTAMTAFYFLDRRKLTAAAAWFAGAILSKYFFLVLISEFRNRRTPLIILLSSVLLFAPFLSARGKLFFSLGAYLENWEFNASLYRLGTLLISDHQHLRLLLALSYLIFWLHLNFKVKPTSSQRPVMLLTGLLLVSPTVHPWYGLWLLPFLVFYRYQAGLLFISLLPLSYIVLENFLATGLWRENYWITALLYSPLLFANMQATLTAFVRYAGQKKSGP